MNKIEIVGERIGGLAITIDGKRVHHVVYHSPDGMQVGYGGSGPADCARSILAHVADKETADKLYQRFKWEVVSKWKHPGGKTELEFDIKSWIDSALKSIDK